MRTFDVRFKKKVVREYLSGKGGYKIPAAKYDIADSLVRRWVGAYQHHGSAGLVLRQARASKPRATKPMSQRNANSAILLVECN